MCSFSGSKFEDTEKLTTYIHMCMPKYVVFMFRDGLTFYKIPQLLAKYF